MNAIRRIATRSGSTVSRAYGFAALMLVPLAGSAGAQTVLQPARSWTLPDIEPNHFAPSPDGRLVLVFDNVDILYVLDRASGTTTEVARGQFVDVVWSPAGNRIAFYRQPEGGGSGHIWTMPVDPATGRPTGAPRRASSRPGRAPWFSGDGEWIAFMSLDDPESSGTVRGPADLLVIPTDGGPERALHEGGGAPRGWSADGEWIYFPSIETTGQHRIWRVAVSGGPAEPVATGTQMLPGVSPDGRLLAYWDGADRVLAGTDGRPLARFRTADDGWGEAWAPPSNALLVGVAGFTSRMQTLSIGTGARRPLGPVFGSAFEMAFSPDGREVAAITRTGEDPSIVSVVGVDGGAVRSYRTVQLAIADPKWSPDGTKLALRTGPVFFPTRRPDIGLEVIDLATGTATALATPPGVFDFVWREDGRAIRYLRFGQTGSEVHAEVREIVLGGEDRLLHAPEGASVDWGFLDFDRVFLGPSPEDSARVILDLSTGRVTPRTEPGAGRPVRSPDGTKWAQPIRPSLPQGRSEAILIVDERSGDRRVIATGLSSLFYFGRGSQLLWHPDGRHIIVSGWAGESLALRQIRLVPIDGSPARVLVDLKVGLWGLSLSPDGRTLVWSESSPPQGFLHEYDLTPLLSGRGN